MSDATTDGYAQALLRLDLLVRNHRRRLEAMRGDAMADMFPQQMQQAEAVAEALATARDIVDPDYRFWARVSERAKAHAITDVARRTTECGRTLPADSTTVPDASPDDRCSRCADSLGG